ncbi:hypothetical protein NC651_025215 [Populus alba x Populus x berolinensis]|nr:hypothetical protein NC651_025215 [Populus alba x Populus x berolinensis]
MASYSETSSDDDEDDMAWFEERLKKKRHRMEDVEDEVYKEVEFERLNMFVDAQLELTKKSFKRDKSTSSSGESHTSAFMANYYSVRAQLRAYALPDFCRQLLGSDLAVHPSGTLI